MPPCILHDQPYSLLTVIIRFHTITIRFTFIKFLREKLSNLILEEYNKHKHMYKYKAIERESGKMSGKILLIDDDKDITELMRIFLERDGYEVVEAYNGLEALKKLEHESFDLAVIDIMMPGMDGLTLVKEIRKTYIFPIILLTAKTSDVDKIVGLGFGADDYLSKPFNPLELTARVQAQLRRYFILGGAPQKADSNKLQLGPFVLDQTAGTFYKNNEEISLTATKYKILVYLMCHVGQVLTKGQIYENVWGDLVGIDSVGNTVITHISRLREKIEENPKQPEWLTTIRGLGYRLNTGDKNA